MVTGIAKRLGLLGACVALVGCAASGPEVLYGLSAPNPTPVAAKRRSVQILVPQPTALKALDTTSIAVAERGPSYTYFGKVAWSDSLPKVFQAQLVETLETTGKLNGVALPGQGLLIDYQLQTTLRSFEVRLDGGNRALVEVSARLVDDRTGRAVRSRVFTASVPSRAVEPAPAVDALNAASDRVVLEMADWVVNSL